jgi:MFS family permease
MSDPLDRPHGSWPLLAGMGLLMIGAGLQGTLLGVRAGLENFGTFAIGLVMACFYVGYMAGSAAAPVLVQRVGHIRVFTALTSVASVTILIQGIFAEPALWAVMRLTSGFCFAGIYVVAESWLNDRATNRSRGTLLALYMLVIYIGLGGGQFLLNVADAREPTLFMIIAVLISLAILPMSLSVQRAPDFDVPHKIAFGDLYRISPLGVVGVMFSGAIASALFSMGPVYAQLLGFESADIATFMGVSILAAVATQVPVGKLSDRVDRRTVLIFVCIVAAVLAACGAVLGEMSKPVLFLVAAGFGGLVLTIYALSLSHINDHLEPKQIVSASATVILLNGIGATAGPLLVALLMDQFGPAAYFGAQSIMLSCLCAYALWRKGRRAPVPSAQKIPFVTVQPQAVSGQMMADAAHVGVLRREDTH